MFADTEADMIARLHHELRRGGGRDRARRRAADMPVAISFTVETDGRLPTGQTLKEAIVAVDQRDRRRARLLHDQLRAPEPFRGVLDTGEPWVEAHPRPPRQCLASCSHAELDAATELDAGSPIELGRQYRELSRRASADQRARRLLRHRPSPCRGDRPLLRHDTQRAAHAA